MIRTLSELRKAMPDVTIENHPYDIGYWLRFADQPIPELQHAALTNGDPSRLAKIEEGWRQAESELNSTSEAEST